MTLRLLKTERGAPLLLLAVTALLLPTGLGARDLWGPETRWAVIALRCWRSYQIVSNVFRLSALAGLQPV